jgi:hypothetical protein
MLRLLVLEKKQENWYDKKGKLVVTSKWIYKIKHAADGSVEKFKTRSIARGFS